MRITSKGQVTIPQTVREELGLLPDTDVDFVVEGQTVRLVRIRRQGRTRGSAAVASLRGRSTIKMTTDQIMALTRGTRRS